MPKLWLLLVLSAGQARFYSLPDLVRASSALQVYRCPVCQPAFVAISYDFGQISRRIPCSPVQQMTELLDKVLMAGNCATPC